MKKPMSVLFMWCLLLHSSVAFAEDIEVSCEEMSQLTGTEMDCKSTPTVVIEEGEYDKLQAVYDAKMSGEDEVAPWKRADTQSTEPDRQDVIDDCSMPIWKRRPGLKCDD